MILVGSGVRDPQDPGLHLGPINRSLNRDLKRKIVARLQGAVRAELNAQLLAARRRVDRVRLGARCGAR